VDTQFAVIGQQGRHREQRPGEEPLVGAFPSLAVEPLVGHFVQPLLHLTIRVGQAGDRAQGPEVLAQVSDAGALDFPFLPW
jgi:hypothetical protein